MSVHALLEECGGADPDSVDERLQIVFPDAAAWRAWSLTQGQRATWAAMPGPERESVLAHITQRLEDARGDDGLIRPRQDVRLTTARVA